MTLPLPLPPTLALADTAEPSVGEVTYPGLRFLESGETFTSTLRSRVFGKSSVTLKSLKKPAKSSYIVGEEKNVGMRHKRKPLRRSPDSCLRSMRERPPSVAPSVPIAAAFPRVSSTSSSSEASIAVGQAQERLSQESMGKKRSPMTSPGHTALPVRKRLLSLTRRMSKDDVAADPRYLEDLPVRRIPASADESPAMRHSRRHSVWPSFARSQAFKSLEKLPTSSSPPSVGAGLTDSRSDGEISSPQMTKQSPLGSASTRSRAFFRRFAKDAHVVDKPPQIKPSAVEEPPRLPPILLISKVVSSGSHDVAQDTKAIDTVRFAGDIPPIVQEDSRQALPEDKAAHTSDSMQALSPSGKGPAQAAQVTRVVAKGSIKKKVPPLVVSHPLPRAAKDMNAATTEGLREEKATQTAAALSDAAPAILTSRSSPARQLEVELLQLRKEMQEWEEQRRDKKSKRVSTGNVEASTKADTPSRTAEKQKEQTIVKESQKDKGLPPPPPRARSSPNKTAVLRVVNQNESKGAREDSEETPFVASKPAVRPPPTTQSRRLKPSQSGDLPIVTPADGLGQTLAGKADPNDGLTAQRWPGKLPGHGKTAEISQTLDAAGSSSLSYATIHFWREKVATEARLLANRPAHLPPLAELPDLQREHVKRPTGWNPTSAEPGRLAEGDQRSLEELLRKLDELAAGTADPQNSQPQRNERNFSGSGSVSQMTHTTTVLSGTTTAFRRLTAQQADRLFSQLAQQVQVPSETQRHPEEMKQGKKPQPPKTFGPKGHHGVNALQSLITPFPFSPGPEASETDRRLPLSAPEPVLLYPPPNLKSFVAPKLSYNQLHTGGAGPAGPSIVFEHPEHRTAPLIEVNAPVEVTLDAKHAVVPEASVVSTSPSTVSTIDTHLSLLLHHIPKKTLERFLKKHYYLVDVDEEKDVVRADRRAEDSMEKVSASKASENAEKVKENLGTANVKDHASTAEQASSQSIPALLFEHVNPDYHAQGGEYASFFAPAEADEEESEGSRGTTETNGQTLTAASPLLDFLGSTQSLIPSSGGGNGQQHSPGSIAFDGVVSSHAGHLERSTLTQSGSLPLQAHGPSQASFRSTLTTTKYTTATEGNVAPDMMTATATATATATTTGTGTTGSVTLRPLPRDCDRALAAVPREGGGQSDDLRLVVQRLASVGEMLVDLGREVVKES